MQKCVVLPIHKVISSNYTHSKWNFSWYTLISYCVFCCGTICLIHLTLCRIGCFSNVLHLFSLEKQQSSHKFKLNVQMLDATKCLFENLTLSVCKEKFFFSLKNRSYFNWMSVLIKLITSICEYQSVSMGSLRRFF